ncbi:pyridoxal-phosphate dependent enzyme [bacterium SCSIO 12741]|nr:pyridoxal-phosphate dependent enzyme [bacterium SCSIO 12741]
MASIQAKEIEKAEARIQGYIHHTPTFSSSGIDKILGCNILFKCENLQRIGAFKARGAFNFALQLSEAERRNGICTHSSGNHAQAIALAAKTLGIPAYIVMPETAPQVKVAAVQEYGAKITFCEPTLQARESTLEEIQEKTGAFFIPPYDHPWIIAGQATAAKEMLEVFSPDVIITPVGGGGLLAGSALSAHYFGNNVKVYGAEPLGADDAKRSFDSEVWVPSKNPDTIADGLLTSLGQTNFKIIQERVSDIITTSDDTIKKAMLLIWERLKLVVEPSAAVPLAAIMDNPEVVQGKKVGIILSGGNLDLKKWSFV